MATLSPQYASPDHHPARLLVVSSDDDDRHVLEGILNPDHWTVLRAFNGTVARLCAAEVDPDVILVESRLPDCTWRDVLEFINTQENPPPVVVMSSAADDRLCAEVLKVGGCDVLPRPLEPTETSYVLTMALKRRRGPDRTGLTARASSG